MFCFHASSMWQAARSEKGGSPMRRSRVCRTTPESPVRADLWHARLEVNRHCTDWEGTRD